MGVLWEWCVFQTYSRGVRQCTISHHLSTFILFCSVLYIYSLLSTFYFYSLHCLLSTLSTLSSHRHDLLWSYEEKCRKEQEATGRHWDHNICSPYQNAVACAAAGAYGAADGLSTTFTPAVAGDQNADPPIPDTHAECEVKLAGALPCDCEGKNHTCIL